MLRKVCSVLSSNILPFSSSTRPPAVGKILTSTSIQSSVNFSSFAPKTFSTQQNLPLMGLSKFPIGKTLLESKPVLEEQTRSVTKFSWKSGRRRTVKAVPARFFRLRWGGWIRVLAGRHHYMWKKSPRQRTRAQQHFLVPHLQAIKLEKMITKHWRRPRYYPEDPYEPYHTREYFGITRTKPWRPEGVDYE